MNEKYYLQDNNLVTRSISGETILVPIKNNVGDLGSIYTLNEVGTLIWQKLDGKTSVAQIINVIVQEYAVAEAEATADVSELLEQLLSAGLIGEVTG